MTGPQPLLVDADWLRRHLGDRELVVAHVGWSPESGTPDAEAAFERGHVPGAVFLDVDRDLAGPAFVGGPGRHPLPDPDAFAETMSRVGVGNETVVIAHDDVGGSVAARLWWMLDATGHRAALLDGGLGAWTGPFEAGPPQPRPRGAFAARAWPRDKVVDVHAVVEALRSGVMVVLDARGADRFRGDVEPIHPVAGHIPGARNAPWSDNLDSNGRFLPADVLRARYEDLGVRHAERTIAHCGSGVTACHAVFAMRLAGIGDAALYEGSWSDWVHEGRWPVATGPEPDQHS